MVDLAISVLDPLNAATVSVEAGSMLMPGSVVVDECCPPGVAFILPDRRSLHETPEEYTARLKRQSARLDI